MKYKFKYRKFMFWRCFVVMGHKLYPDLDRMDIFFPDGSIRSIGSWSKCDFHLGTDWVLSTKKEMESSAGVSIHLATEENK